MRPITLYDQPTWTNMTRFNCYCHSDNNDVQWSMTTCNLAQHNRLHQPLPSQAKSIGWNKCDKIYRSQIIGFQAHVQEGWLCLLQIITVFLVVIKKIKYLQMTNETLNWLFLLLLMRHWLNSLAKLNVEKEVLHPHEDNEGNEHPIESKRNCYMIFNIL